MRRERERGRKRVKGHTSHAAEEDVRKERVGSAKLSVMAWSRLTRNCIIRIICACVSFFRKPRGTGKIRANCCLPVEEDEIISCTAVFFCFADDVFPVCGWWGLLQLLAGGQREMTSRWSDNSAEDYRGTGGVPTDRSMNYWWEMLRQSRWLCGLGIGSEKNFLYHQTEFFSFLLRYTGCRLVRVKV